MSKEKKSPLKKLLMLANVLLIVGLAGTSVYLFMDNRDLKSTASLSQDEKSQIENDKLVAEISKLMNLPSDEEPTIFKVNDPKKTEEGNPGITQIFSDLQKDDYLLVYKNDRLGIQYRPSENKIIKTATISLPITVEIIGSEDVVNKTEEKLQKLYNGRVVIVEQVMPGITQSFVYDKTGKLKADVEVLAKETGLEVGSTLPQNIKPGDGTEIVIVVASDKSTQTTPVEP